MNNIYAYEKIEEMKKCPFGIFVNQAGYYPKGKKTAVMAFPTESFSVADENGRVCFEGKTVRFGLDKCSGDEVYTADFSAFEKSGSYRVTAGGETSALFGIGRGVYEKVSDDIIRSFYYLRCGCGLEEKYAGVYKHGRCHTAPALLWEDKKTVLDVSGGWHDAGDYGRYVTAGACAAAHMLYAFRMFPKVFEGRRGGIPESGLPALLAECRYELEWLIKMQRSDGAVYHKATTENHAPFVMPEDDKAQMYVFAVSSMAAADLAAVCALASGVYEKYDGKFSERLRAAAELSCGWLDSNPDFVGFDNPEGCNTGPYGEKDDFSNRFWAYAEMYALTGSEVFHEKMKNALGKEFPLTGLGYTEMGGFGSLAYLLCGRKTDRGIAEKLAGSFHGAARRLSELADGNGYGCAMSEHHFYWGSNMNVLKHGMIFAVSDFLSGSGRYRDKVNAQLDYLLGVNPLGYSYVTGNGEFRSNYPHLRPAYADGVEECIPGMVCGGPNRQPGDEAALRFIPEGTPPMKCYADDFGCYSLNEITIYWNSPAVFVLGYLQNGEL